MNLFWIMFPVFLHKALAVFLSQAYLDRHPDTVMIDPLACLRKLIKRFDTYELIKETKICSESQ